MKKHFLMSLLLVAMPQLGVVAQDDASFYIDGLGYTVGSGKATVVNTDATSLKADVVLPATIEHNGKTYAVSAVGTKAFANVKRKLHSVVISDNVTTIGDNAFAGCTKLQYVQMPKSLTTIGTGAFNGCSVLPYVVIPSTVQGDGYSLWPLGDASFTDCPKLEHAFMLGTAPENAYAVSGYDFNFEYDSPTKFIIKDNDTAESSYSNAWASNYSDHAARSWQYAFPKGKKFACFTLGVNVDVSQAVANQLKVYAVSGVDNSKSKAFLTLTPITTVVPAGTPVIFQKGKATKYTFTIAEDDNAQFGGDNLLRPALYDISTSSNDNTVAYTLADSTFVRANTATVAQGGAYLQLPASADLKDTYYILDPGAGEPDTLVVTDGKATVSLEQAGMLKQKLEDKANVITDLTVKGNLNGDDIAELRRMAGYDGGDENLTVGVLNRLDLTGARIVRGGGSFYQEDDVTARVTADDEIPAFCFKGCWKLREVLMPSGAKAIGKSAFEKCYYLRATTVPEHVKTIGDNAYLGNWRMKSVVLNDSLEYIGDNAFRGIAVRSFSVPNSVTHLGTRFLAYCDSLQTVSIGAGVTSLGFASFAMDSVLTSITLPAGLKTVAGSAFIKCKMLPGVTLPEGLESIGDLAFFDMDSLRSVNIPSTVTSIGNSAFAHSTSLESIELPFGLKYVGQNMFTGCHSLRSVVLPSDMKTIPVETFYATALKTIDLPDGLKTIGDRAFADCDSLLSVAIPQSVDTLGSRVFESDSLLQQVTFPDGLTSLNEPFYLCRNLKTVHLPESLTEIANGLFYDNPNLSEVNVPGHITRIGDGAFYKCSALKQFPFPASLTEIGDFGFSYCRNLETITIGGNLTKIGEGCFGYNNVIEQLDIPAGMKRIGERAFVGCGNLKRVSFPDDNHFVAYGLFAYCNKLAEVKLSPNTQTVSAYAFSNCTSLKSIKLPQTLEHLDWNAFENCVSLDTVECESPTPLALEEEANPFPGINADCVLLVPDGSIDSYKQATVWKNFRFIIDRAATGINAVINSAPVSDNQPVYNLRGQYVGNSLDGLPSGIYITRGKKIVVK